VGFRVERQFIWALRRKEITREPAGARFWTLLRAAGFGVKPLGGYLVLDYHIPRGRQVVRWLVPGGGWTRTGLR